MRTLFAISGGAALVLAFSACDAKDERKLQNSVESKTDRLEYEDRGLTKRQLVQHAAKGADPEQPAAAEPAQGVSPSGAQSSGVVEEKAKDTEGR